MQQGKRAKIFKFPPLTSLLPVNANSTFFFYKTQSALERWNALVNQAVRLRSKGPHLDKNGGMQKLSANLSGFEKKQSKGSLKNISKDFNSCKIQYNVNNT